MSFLDLFRRKQYPIYHRVHHKNRRDALIPCSGVAFFRRIRGPVPMNEIPERCVTCGQPIRVEQLSFETVVDVTPTSRRPRHLGQIVTERDR